MKHTNQMGGIHPPNETTDLSGKRSRSSLNQLLTDSKLYKQSKDYKELLDFVARMRNLAPFNAMLLQIQKPGLSYAASAKDWRENFGRWPKEGARPLLILRPFGPVDLVYDVMDTEGKKPPEDVNFFPARGHIDKKALIDFRNRLEKKNIKWLEIDVGDRKAGSIRVILRPSNEKEYTLYQITINTNHAPPIQFATLIHELGHLFLGHLGENKNFKVPLRPILSHTQKELEAESVSYLVCERNNVKSKSKTYLSNYVQQNTTLDDIDIYRVLCVVGEIERLLDLPNIPERTDLERQDVRL